ncbi:potassium transporter TrkG [Marivirga harenae]|uniref:TrkH family potassium uptake protein n=1 Tax=Marivirga harenae TaxID=2010992 RepID=UPI0026E0EEFA|nr:potassium transporter TrkG [Marivirga harenae]WKV13707.1 potassium transporter TrkG [Marivirga harenae]|tara:strand:+ start:78047 stop:79870 length:1824 start_codon:yes stop_codon:yes gene_type:complete
MNISRIKNTIIELLNNAIYKSKKPVLTTVRSVKVFLWIAACVILLYEFGYDVSSDELKQVFLALDIILLFYFLSFIIRWLYSFRRLEFLQSHKLEFLLVIIILINSISYYAFDNRIVHFLQDFFEFNSYADAYQTLLAFYFIVLISYEGVKASVILSQLKTKPARTFIISFIILIFFGTGVLMFPEMSVKHETMSFMDALFTAVSASCVTGLIVVDTATYFSLKGQFVIMILMQFGGLGIITFASFLASLLKTGVGIKQQLMLQDFLESDSLFSAKGLLSKIFFITFLVEFIAFILIFFSWGHDVHFNTVGQKVFFSAFHSVSAFCNAGFSLFTNGLFEQGVATSYILHIIIAITLILGGIGFSSLQDLFSVTNLRERFKSPWKEWKLSTKIAVYTSMVLLFTGMIAFYFIERNNTLADMNFMEAMITSFFQSATARTAGFNTVDFSALKIPALVLISFLMFVGASSGSVGGGIKTSTFYLLIKSVIATLNNRAKIEIDKKFIPKELLYKALSVFFFAATMNLVAIFALTITDGDISLERLIFEQVSAFGTVGLSTGITADLSLGGRIIIILSMFIGRVGTLTFALALSNRATTTTHKYPKAHLMVG